MTDNYDYGITGWSYVEPLESAMMMRRENAEARSRKEMDDRLETHVEALELKSEEKIQEIEQKRDFDIDTIRKTTADKCEEYSKQEVYEDEKFKLQEQENEKWAAEGLAKELAEIKLEAAKAVEKLKSEKEEIEKDQESAQEELDKIHLETLELKINELIMEAENQKKLDKAQKETDDKRFKEVLYHENSVLEAEIEAQKELIEKEEANFEIEIQQHRELIDGKVLAQENFFKIVIAEQNLEIQQKVKKSLDEVREQNQEVQEHAGTGLRYLGYKCRKADRKEARGVLEDLIDQISSLIKVMNSTEEALREVKGSEEKDQLTEKLRSIKGKLNRFSTCANELIGNLMGPTKTWDPEQVAEFKTLKNEIANDIDAINFLNSGDQSLQEAIGSLSHKRKMNEIEE